MASNLVFVPHFVNFQSSNGAVQTKCVIIIMINCVDTKHKEHKHMRILCMCSLVSALTAGETEASGLALGSTATILKSLQPNERVAMETP